MLAQFDRAAQAFGVHFAPIEADAGIGGFVDGANQAAIGGGQAHHVAEPVFGAVQVGQGRFQRAAEEEVLFAGLGFLVGFTAAGFADEQGMHFAPGLQGGIAADFGGADVAVGEVQFPVGVFDVGDEVAHAGFEIGQADIGADAGDDHAVVLQVGADAAERIERAGDAVVQAAGALQQRLLER